LISSTVIFKRDEGRIIIVKDLFNDCFTRYGLSKNDAKKKHHGFFRGDVENKRKNELCSAQ